MAISEKNLAVKTQSFASRLEVGANSTFPVYRSPQDKTSYIKKIIVTNNTGTNGTFDIGLYENSFIPGGNVFAAIASYTTTAASSTDSITWTVRTLPAPANNGFWSTCTYGAGVFVAVAGSTTAASSTDGITWTERTLPIGRDWSNIAYGNGNFSLIATNTTSSSYSTDGITWTLTTMPTSGSWLSICYGNDKFVAIRSLNDSTNTAYSTNGIVWTAGTIPAANWQSVAYGNGLFVAVGTYSSAATSTDGISWVSRTSAASDGLRRVVYGNDTFVAIAPSGTTANYSTNGILWNLSTLPISRSWKSITYGNGVFSAIASYTTSSTTSTDGITWTLRTMPTITGNAWWAITYPQNSDFTNNTYLYKSQTINANITTSLNYEIVVPPTHEIRVRSTVPVSVTVQGDR